MLKNAAMVAMKHGPTVIDSAIVVFVKVGKLCVAAAFAVGGYKLLKSELATDEVVTKPHDFAF